MRVRNTNVHHLWIDYWLLKQHNPCILTCLLGIYHKCCEPRARVAQRSRPDGVVCIAESHQVLAQLLDTLLVIGTQLPESPAVRHRLIEVACKVEDVA